MSILEVKNVSKSFGGVKANVDISMSVEKGKIVGLIGPNGSGKTTLFNSIVGTYPIDTGSIKFNNKDVSELPVPVIAKLGLLRTFQQTRIYGKLNCIDNMLISHKGSDESLIKIFSKIPQDLTDKADPIREHDCIWCMACVSVCPPQAIKVDQSNVEKHETAAKSL